MEIRVRPKRKAIPKRVKVEVLDRQHYCCAACKNPFSIEGPIQYDHRPALEQRPVNDAGTDYVPAQLDPDYIEALHKPCHDERTFGRKPDAEKTVTTKGSDAWLAKKFRRLEGRVKKKPKQKIPQRKNPWGNQSRTLRGRSRWQTKK